MTTTPKCPCCNNPWARATGDVFAQMCGECQTSTTEEKDKTPSFGLSRSNMDETVSPNDNFYRYANGGWIANNPIPSGYPNWNTFLTLHVQSQERCQQLLQELEDQAPESSTEEASKVARFYKAAMDEDAIEKDGTDSFTALVVVPHIQQIVKAYQQENYTEYATLLGKLHSQCGIGTFFGVPSASPDSKNSSQSICQLGQGGLHLPDRDYYFDEDKQDKRDAYIQHICNLLILYETSKEKDMDDGKKETLVAKMKTMASRIFALEKTLAAAHMTRTENRDPYATYNKMTVDGELMILVKGEKEEDDDDMPAEKVFDFPSYFVSMANSKSLPDLGNVVNVRNTRAIAKAARVAMTLEIDETEEKDYDKAELLEFYLLFSALSSCAPYMSKAFVNEHFEFNEKILSGTQELKPRWKRAMTFTESAIGEGLGKLYCAKYFDEECKERALVIVEKVRKALEDRLKEVDWIKSDSTREQAIQKMSKFRVKIGYPNEWIDYSKLVFDDNDSFMSMVLKARAFDHQRTVDEMNAPTNREKWFMTPQTVNAYYHPMLNEIVFPAAILQHPFFDKNADDAVNFGAMGAVVGHEMTHGFDDKGRKFNYAGILQDWWTEEDATEYEKRVQVMVDQADAFQVHGKSVQGKLTSGENIADLGGLRLALRALKQQEGYNDSQEIDGFTPTQRFFLAWAQCWRQNITKERSLQLVTLDPHGPNEMRCNGPLSNMSEFHSAFGISKDSVMYRPAEARVDIW